MKKIKKAIDIYIFIRYNNNVLKIYNIDSKFNYLLFVYYILVKKF